MSNFLAISKEKFLNRRWLRPSSFLFAAKDAVCPLTVHELPQAIMSGPVAFVKSGENFVLVALLGLQPQKNLFVNSAGAWIGRYIPAHYRNYPFILANNEAQEGQLVLCIDEESGLLADDEGDVESDDAIDNERIQRFFEEDGELAPFLKTQLDFLTSLYSSKVTSTRLCKVLQKHNLLKVWELQIQNGDTANNVEGLYCIDESALNSLSDDAYIAVRQSGAIPLTYCQLLSMQHVSDLSVLAQAPIKPDASSLPGELDFDSISDHGNISFDNF